MANTITEAIREGEIRRAFWNEHYAEFARDFPDKFVAVKSGKVVATDEDLLGVLQKLQILDLKPGGDVDFEFIAVSPRTLLL